MLASSREFVNKRMSVDKLADDLEEYFQNAGYTTQRADKGDSHLIQAQKAGILRDLIAGDRAFTVLISGDPNKVKVSIGVGKWLQNLTVSVLEALVLTPLVFFLEIPVSLWSYEIEVKLWQFIDKQVELRSSPSPV